MLWEVYGCLVSSNKNAVLFVIDFKRLIKPKKKKTGNKPWLNLGEPAWFETVRLLPFVWKEIDSKSQPSDKPNID